MSERIDRNEIEELLFSIEHAAHAEYHLLEVVMNNLALYKNREPELINSTLELLRNTRRELMSKLEEKRPNVGPLWCTLKHTLLLHFHLFELYEKYQDIGYLTMACRIWDKIGDLLKDQSTFVAYEHCAICNQDRTNIGSGSNSTES